MKVLKSLFIGALAFSTLTAQAQDSKATKTERMAARYDLSEDQSSKVESAMNTFMVTSQKIKADQTTTNEVKKSQLAGAKAKLDASMKATLSEEQYKKYASDKAQKQIKRADSRAQYTPEKKAEAQTKQMVTDLALTPEQAEKVGFLNLKVAKKIQAVHTNPNLTKEQKKEFVQGNKKDRMGALSAILTPEQYKLYETKLASVKTQKKANRKEVSAPANN